MGKQLYHISPIGVGKCDATVRTCQFKGEGTHSVDIVELAQRYEVIMKDKEIATHKKKTSESADKRGKVAPGKAAPKAIRNASESAGRANKGNEPANQNQFDFIKTLKRERIVPEEFNAEMERHWREGTFTHAKAFEFIRTMRTFVERKDIVSHHESLVGYHNINGRLIKVNRSKSGYMYVQELQFSQDGKEARSRQVKIETLNEINEKTPLSQKEAIDVDRRLLSIGKIK